MNTPISDRGVNDVYSILFGVPVRDDRVYRAVAVADGSPSSVLYTSPRTIRPLSYDTAALQTYPTHFGTSAALFPRTMIADDVPRLSSSLETSPLLNIYPPLETAPASRISSLSSLSPKIARYRSGSKMASAIDGLVNYSHDEGKRAISDSSRSTEQFDDVTALPNLRVWSSPTQSRIDDLEKEQVHKDSFQILDPRTTDGIDKFRKSSRNFKIFPVILHQILSRKDLDDIISWCPHGRAWKVHNPRVFEDKVLKLYFNQTKYSSFSRQVNGWGFCRILHGPDRNSYYHEMFLRGLPHLCNKMRRLKTGSVKPDIKGQSEPNFYRISEIFPLPECEDDTLGTSSETILSATKIEPPKDIQKANVEKNEEMQGPVIDAVHGKIELNPLQHLLFESQIQKNIKKYFDAMRQETPNTNIGRSHLIPFNVFGESSSLQKYHLMKEVLSLIRNNQQNSVLNI
mmetsp:Transcript_7174/g.8930  ORF Transcript_7174/g.8930 Transcript_7174/m.8930 type:complete len:457 (-) Transcript_7174:181-1551(-)